MVLTSSLQKEFKRLNRSKEEGVVLVDVQGGPLPQDLEAPTSEGEISQPVRAFGLIFAEGEALEVFFQSRKCMCD